jgi:hypothetical protein
MAAMTDPRERLRRTAPGDRLIDGAEEREVVTVECATTFVARLVDEQMRSGGYSPRAVEMNALYGGLPSRRR